MKRDDAMVLLENFMRRFIDYSEEFSVKTLFIFGSFSKGYVAPNDIDFFMILKSDSPIQGYSICKKIHRKFVGQLQNIDLLICNEKEFEEFRGYKFNKDDLICIWNYENNDWKSIIAKECKVNESYERKKSFQFKEFRADFPQKTKIQKAVDERIIKVEEIPAEKFYSDEGPWEIQITYEEENGKWITETENLYDEYIEFLNELKEKEVSGQYINTLKVLYSNAYRNDIVIDSAFRVHISPRHDYQTFIESDDQETILRFYIVDLDLIFHHLSYSDKVEQVILIPRYKVRSKNNYIYKVCRGQHWSKEAIKELKRLEISSW